MMVNGNKYLSMRKLYNCMVASLLFLAVSCQQEEIASVEPGTDVFEVYASIEDIDDEETRTYLSGNEVYWSSGDKIAVFYKNTLRKRFDVTPESIDSKNATFLLDEGYVQMGSNVNVSHNVAYYPFCEVTCAPDGSSYTLSNLTLPSTQSYVEGSVGLGAFPMVAVTENTDDVNFCFKNICGVMQFQLNGSGFVKSVSVRGNRGEVLAGSAVVTAGYGKEPSISMSAEGVKEVTLDCGESGVELNETTPVSFFIVLPPVGFEDGFTITVTDIWGGSKEYSTAKKNPIVRSKGLRMPSKEYIGVRPPQEGDYIDEYGVNHGQGIEIDGVVWAPVNCGYHETDFKYGKMYQWGRKYGQGFEGEFYDGDWNQTYSDAIAPTIEDGGISAITGQHKNKAGVFFAVTYNYNWDWLYPQDDKLWGYEGYGSEFNPIKTEFDPCPEGWRVPTYKELDKLNNNYSSWITDENGQSGRWFSGEYTYTETSSKVFLPAAGERIPRGNAYNRGVYGGYWSLCPYGSSASYLRLDSDDVNMYDAGRAYGFSVRCVRDKSGLVPVASVTLTSSSLTLSVGNTAKIEATITPSNANHQFALWWSEDESIAAVDSNGKITAVAEGTTTITAMAGMQTAECVVTVLAVQEGDYIDEYGVNHGQGIEIDGVVWAPVNCGYKAPTADSKGFPYGKLYQWGRKYGQGYSLDYDESEPIIMEGPVSLEEAQSLDNEVFFYKYGNHYTYDCITPMNDKYWNSGTEENPKKSQYDPCPNGWRVPTITELNNLRNNKSSETINSVGIEGCWFSGFKVYSDSVPRVFLPVAGSRGGHYGDIYERGFQGDYWSSTVSRKDGPYSYCAQYLHFISSYDSLNDSGRAHAHSVRCVQE